MSENLFCSTNISLSKTELNAEIKNISNSNLKEVGNSMTTFQSSSFQFQYCVARNSHMNYSPVIKGESRPIKNTHSSVECEPVLINNDMNIKIEDSRPSNKFKVLELKNIENPLPSSESDQDEIEIYKEKAFPPKSQIKTLEYIDHGGQATVFRIIDTKTKEEYAKRRMKIHSNQDLNDFDKSAKREIDILQKIIQQNDPSLLKIYLIKYQPYKKLTIVMELGRGDLFSFAVFREFRWTKCELISISNQLYHQIHKLKEMGIYHRDIKPKNIIISKDWTLKLGDFGLAQQFDDDKKETKGRGTPGYWSPENMQSYYINQKKIIDLFKADIYSIGITLKCIIKKAKSSVCNQFKQRIDEMCKIDPTERHIEEIKEKNSHPEDLTWKQYGETFSNFQLKTLFRETEQKGRVLLYFMTQDIFLELKEELKNQLEEAFKKDDKLAQAIVWAKLGQMRHQQGQYDKAIESFQEAINIYHTISNDSKKIAILYYEVGITYFFRKRYEDSQKSFRIAYNMTPATGNFDDTYLHMLTSFEEIYNDIHKARMYFGLIVYRMMNFDELSYEPIDLSTNYLEQIILQDTLTLANEKDSLKKENAIQLLSNFLSTHIIKPKRKCWALAVKAYHLILLNEDDEALKQAEASMALKLERYGKNHLLLVMSYQLFGLVYFKKKDYEMAKKNFSEILDILSHGCQKPFITLAFTNSLIGSMAYKHGDYKEAEVYYRVAKEILVEISPGHPQMEFVKNQIEAIESHSEERNEQKIARLKRPVDPSPEILEKQVQELEQKHQKDLEDQRVFWEEKLRHQKIEFEKKLQESQPQ